MNVLKKLGILTVKTISVICVPVALIDIIGSPGLVQGTSMEPTLKGDSPKLWKNDIVWLRKCFIDPPQEGQIFVFTSPRDQEKTYIKRLVKGPGRRAQWKDGTNTIVPENHFWFLADNPNNAIDSTYFGAVNRGLLIAQATRIIWPPSRWRKL